jgi:hypothetical protein
MNCTLTLKDILRHGLLLRLADDDIKNDPYIVMCAVKQNGLALCYASPEMQNCFNIVMEAVKKNGFALDYASHELQNNRNIVASAVQQNALALDYASLEMKNDFDVMMAAVKINGFTLRYASPELQNNNNIVASAVQQNGCALSYASPEMQNNEHMMLLAMMTHECAFFDSHIRQDAINVQRMLNYVQMEIQIVSKFSKKIMFDVIHHVKLGVIISIIDPQCVIMRRIIYESLPFCKTSTSSLFLSEIIQKIKTYIKNSWHDINNINMIMCTVRSSTAQKQIFDAKCPIKKLYAHGQYMCVNFETKIKEYLGPIHLKDYAYLKDVVPCLFALLH